MHVRTQSARRQRDRNTKGLGRQAEEWELGIKAKKRMCLFVPASALSIITNTDSSSRIHGQIS